MTDKAEPKVGHVNFLVSSLKVELLNRGIDRDRDFDVSAIFAIEWGIRWRSR